MSGTGGTDVASLGFSIDTSSLVNANAQLDTFAAGSDKVRASNEFMVRSLSNSSAAFAELATNGRASLMSFVAIAQNLDMVTDKLTALRTAAAAAGASFQGGVLTAANTDIQREFSTMATIFGTTAGQLELYNKQATYLGMNSQQVAASIQRITEAMKDQTSAGAAMRQVLVGAGVNMNQDASQIYAQFIQNERGRAPDAQRFNEVQTVLGQQTPASYQQLMEPNYIPARVRGSFQDQQDATRITGPQDQSNALIARSLDQADANFRDLRSLYGSSVDNNRDLYKFLQPSTASGRQLNAELAKDGGPSSQAGATDIMNMMYAHQDQLGLFSYTPSAMGYGIEHGALSHDFSLPGGDYRPARFGGGSPLSSPGISVNPGGNFGNWYRNRFGDESGRFVSNENTIDVDERADEQKASAWQRLLQIPEDRAINRRIENQFGLYKPPANVVQGGKVVASEAYLNDAATANQMSQFGDDSLDERLNAQNMIGIDGNTGTLGDPIVRTRMAALYGDKEADQRLAQMRGEAAYTVANVTSPGFDQLQNLQGQQYVAGQAPQQSAEAGQLLGYGQQLGLDTGDWQNQFQKNGMSIQDIINGKGPANDVLTDREKDAFTKIEAGNAAVVTGQSSQDTATNIQEQKDLQAAVSAGAGAVQEATAVWEAYQAALAKTSDPAALAKVRTDAQKSWLASQTTAFQTQQTEMERAADDLQKQIEAGSAALVGGQPGAFGAAQSEQQIQEQMREFRQSSQSQVPGAVAQRDAALRRNQQQDILSGAQTDEAGAQSAAMGGQDRLSAILSGGGSHEENVLQTNLDYASQMATATGKTKDALEASIASIVTFKDSLDQTNQAMADLTSGLQSQSTIGADQAAMSAAPGQREAVEAGFRAKAGVLMMNNPLLGMPAGATAALAPDQALINGASASSGVPAAFLSAQVFDESSGRSTVPGQSPDGPYGVGQIKPQTAVGLKIKGPGFDYRGDPTRAIPAMADLDAQNMAKIHGSWKNPADRGRVGAMYGTVPFSAVGGDVLGTGEFAGGSAYEAAIAGQQLQALSVGEATSFGRQQFGVEAPYLARGETGAASIAGARLVAPGVPDPEKAATQASQLAAAQDQLTRSMLSLNSQMEISTENAAAMAAAYAKGPQAVADTQALIAAQQSARQNGQDTDPNSAYVRDQTSRNLRQNAQNQTQQVSQSNAGTFQANQLQEQTLADATIANPYAREVQEAIDQAKSENKQTPDASPDVLAANIALKEQAAQLDIIAQKQSDVAQGMGQIGDAVSGTLSNVAFSYQHGPGAGRYAQQQISGLLGSGARSLFDITVGDPIQKYVTGGLSSFANELMGNTNIGGAVGPGSNDQGGTSSGGLLGGIGSSLTGGLVSSLGGRLFGGLFGGGATAPLVSDTSMDAANLGTGALESGVGGGLFGKLGGFLSNIFAAGGAVNKGYTIPFASGGMFDDGPQTVPMALLGEAGPEAVMPLHRGPDGRLGVVNHGSGGGGGGTSIIVQAPITITGANLGANGKMDSRTAANLQNQVQEMVKTGVKSVLGDEKRPGGMLYS